MKCISAVTIGKLIEAHIEHDEQKFISYANFIAEAYGEAGEERKAKIIRSKLDGTYKNQPKVTLDSCEKKQSSSIYLCYPTKYNSYMDVSGDRSR